MAELFEYAGNMHMHTPYSDGEKWHKEVAEEAARAGLDFIIVTDHNVWVDAVEGYYEFDDRRVLLLSGEEIHDMRRKPQANHFLVYGAERELSCYAPNPQELIDATNAAGGYGFLAHPFELPLPLFGGPDLGWHDWDVDGFTGLEIWNYMSSFKNVISRKLSRLSTKNGLYARLTSFAWRSIPRSISAARSPRFCKSGMSCWQPGNVSPLSATVTPTARR